MVCAIQEVHKKIADGGYPSLKTLQNKTPHDFQELEGTFYHKTINVTAKTIGNIRMCQSFQAKRPQRTDTQLEIRMDENKFS